MVRVKLVSNGALGEVYLNGHKLDGVQGYKVEHNIEHLPVVTLRVVADVECEQLLSDRMLKKAPPKGWARRIPKYVWLTLKSLANRSQVQDICWNKDNR